MNALKETIIRKLDSLPESALQRVVEYLTILAHERGGGEPSLLLAAGSLSGAPMSGEEIDHELYGKPPAP